MFNKKKIAIIGLGYVGLPLAKSFSKFFQTVGYDIDLNLVNRLNKKSNGDYVFSNDPNVIRDSNIFIITVPTPVNSNNLPDLSFLKSATK